MKLRTSGIAVVLSLLKNYYSIRPNYIYCFCKIIQEEQNFRSPIKTIVMLTASWRSGRSGRCEQEISITNNATNGINVILKTHSNIDQKSS